MKRAIPKRVFLIALVPVAIAVGVGYMWHFTQKRMHPTEDVTGRPLAPGAAGAVAAAPASSAGGAARVSYKSAVDDAKQFVFERTARVDGLPHTAPRYDEITKPETAPVPAACISFRERCSCFTQQATPMIVDDDACRQIVAHGYFIDFQPDGQKRVARGESGQRVVSADAVPVRAVVEPADRVTVLGDGSGFGVLGKSPMAAR